jgi:hypothetical protein
LTSALDGDERSASPPGLEGMEKRKILPFPGIEMLGDAIKIETK